MSSYDATAAGTSSVGDEAAPPVEALEQVVGRELDRLVPPLRRPVHARDQAHAVHAAEVAVDEAVAGLRLLRGALRQAEVPVGVLLPRVRCEEGVLVGRLGLHR